MPFSALIEFALTTPTSIGTLTIPQSFSAVALNGRQSKVLVTDFTFGSKSHVLYSTASIFFAGTIGSRDVLFLFGDSDQSHEISVMLAGTHGARTSKSTTRVKFGLTTAGFTLISVLPGSRDLVTLWESDSQIVLFSDDVTAATFWAPALSLPSATSNFKNYWQFGSNDTVLIGGPYLVRNATFSSSKELALRGDLNKSTTLTVIASNEIKSVSWNGEHVSLDFAQFTDDDGAVTHTSSVILTGRLEKKVSNIAPPMLTNWKFRDSLPEIGVTFSDEEWILANHTTTNIRPLPSFGDGRILYGTLAIQIPFTYHSTIGHLSYLMLWLWVVSAILCKPCASGKLYISLSCENIVLWRGHFIGSNSTTSANLSIDGGFSTFLVLTSDSLDLHPDRLCCFGLAQWTFLEFNILSKRVDECFVYFPSWISEDWSR